MRVRIAAAVVGAAILGLAVPAAVQAPGPRDITDVLLRVNGPLRIGAGDTASTVVVVGHDARIEGTVLEQLVVIGGTAHIEGTVRGNLVVVDGRAELGPAASVGGDVVLHESTLARAQGARVGGVVRERAELDWGPVVGWLLWLSLTAVVLAVGLVFAAIAGRQLSTAAAQIPTHPGPVVLTALILLLGLPILAVLSFISVIGIPLGLLIVIFLIPALALLGYLVTACWLGGAARRRWGGRAEADRAASHPYLAVLIGVLALQIVGLLPILGGLVQLLASQLGAGALAYRSWRATHADART